MTINKTILGPDTGQGIDLLAGTAQVDQPAYSEGIRLDFPAFTWIMLSGVLALDDDLEVVAPGDLRAQTHFVLEAIDRILQTHGSGMDDICRVRVYVVGGIDAQRFGIIHEERAKFFTPGRYPASTLVEVVSLIKPELLIEIDADAILEPRDPTSDRST